MSGWPNIVAIARREFNVRVHTRSFVLGTLLLVVGVMAIALLPVIIQQLDRTSTTKLAVAAPTRELAATTAARLDALLNVPVGGATPAVPGPGEQPDYVVSVAPDLASARQAVSDGTYSAVLGLERASDGSLTFTLYTNDQRPERSAALAQQAVNAIAIADRLERLGVAPAEQATLFGPAELRIAWADPAKTEPVMDTVGSVSQDVLSFGMTILIFMIIVMYGNWIAMSVVEEKTSRVMEVVLNAATPFQLLAGKVFGVGSVAFLQYAAVVAAGVVALLVQGQVASWVFGSTASTISLPEGLTPALLLAFGVYGILGFLLYASLFAAAGSLVSRQEDVNAAVMPMTLLSTVGYIVGVYAAMGLIDIHAGWLVILTLVPFLSPFMMLGRAATGVATPWEVLLSIALLVAAIGVAIWIAARIYAAGVLLYGQRPGARAVWRLLREGM